jgi:hypothetical protein
MRKRWLLCVLLGTLAWGQAQPGTAQAPAPAGQGPASRMQPPSAPAAEVPFSEVPLNAVVLTVKGVCPATPKTAAVAKTAAGKTTAAKKPADCKTEITRAQFEKLTSALQQGSNPLNTQQKRTLANQLPGVMAMSEAAKAKGLDKTERFQETMKFIKMRVLTAELQRTVQDDADKVPPEKIAEYYKENSEAYQQFSLDRLFIPRYKQPGAEEKKEDAKDSKEEKPTDEQLKAKDAENKAKQEKGEQEMNKLADSLRERAAAGEDFATLQKEAFEAAGTKVANPTVNLPKVRRTGLPPAHSAVFDLKVGEVSTVISDNGGHYVYKVVSMEVLPLDQVKEEIHGKLKKDRLTEMTDKYTNSFQAVPNEAYFGPGPLTAPGGRPPGQMPARMPPPRAAPPSTEPQSQAPPPAADAPAQPPAPPAPASKPN